MVLRKKTFMSICDLKIGEYGFIIDHELEFEEELKLLDLGLVQGEKIRVTKIAPLGDPIELEVMNYSLCVRRENADRIKVKSA